MSVPPPRRTIVSTLPPPPLPAQETKQSGRNSYKLCDGPNSTYRPTLVSGLLDPGYLTPPTLSHVQPIPRHSPPSCLFPSPKLTKICNQLFRCHVGFSGPHERLCLLTCTKTIMQYSGEAMLHVVISEI